jgi:hypothetical protein
MKFANKDFSYYFDIIKWPTLLLLVWSIAAFIMALVNFTMYMSIFSTIPSMIISVVLFGLAGWLCVKDHKGGLKQSAWSGALTGVIVGFVGAVLSLIIIYTVPEMLQYTISHIPNQAQVDIGMVEKVMFIYSWIGLIVNPIIDGLIGALIGLLGGFIGKKI